MNTSSPGDDWTKPTPEENAAMIHQAFDHGIKNLEFHLASAEILNRDSNATVNIIGAAGFGALGYTAHLMEENAPLALWVATGLVSLHLLFVAWLIIRRCVWAADLAPAWNEAANLYHPGYTCSEVLLGEIKSMPFRLDSIITRNAAIGSALNHLRTAAFFAPFTFLAAWAAGMALDWA